MFIVLSVRVSSVRNRHSTAETRCLRHHSCRRLAARCTAGGLRATSSTAAAHDSQGLPVSPDSSSGRPWDRGRERRRRCKTRANASWTHSATLPPRSGRLLPSPDHAGTFRPQPAGRPAPGPGMRAITVSSRRRRRAKDRVRPWLRRAANSTRLRSAAAGRASAIARAPNQ